MNPYIFVHINKTGGTSLWKLLNRQPEHRLAFDYRQDYTEEEWDSLIKFTIVRNPFDRAVSLFEYRRARNAQNILEDRFTFHQFLEAALVKKIPPYFNRASMLGPQYDWLTDLHGNLIIPHIFSFENYRDSIGQILKLLGHKDPFGVPIPHVKQVEHNPWQSYYEGEEGELCRQIILQEWGKDFYHFNYPKEIRNGILRR